MSAYGQSRQLSRRLSEATKIPLCLCFRLCRHPDPGKPVLLLEDIWWCGWRQGSARRNRHFPTSFPKPSFFTAARYKVPCFQIILLDFCTTLVPPYSSISFCGSISVVQQVFFFLRLTSCFFLQCWKSFIWLCWNSQRIASEHWQYFHDSGKSWVSLSLYYSGGPGLMLLAEERSFLHSHYFWPSSARVICNPKRINNY